MTPKPATVPRRSGMTSRAAKLKNYGIGASILSVIGSGGGIITMLYDMKTEVQLQSTAHAITNANLGHVVDDMRTLKLGLASVEERLRLVEVAVAKVTK